MRIALISLFASLPLFGHELQYGECRLRSASLGETSKIDSSSCIKGSSTLHYLKSLDEDTTHWSKSVHAYAGNYFGHQSIHARFEMVELTTQRPHGLRHTRTFSDLKLLTYRLGKLGRSERSISVGLQSVPFSVGHKLFKDIYRIFTDQYFFWPRTQAGVTAGWDDLKNSSVEVGLGRDSSHGSTKNDAIAARYTYDFSALGGTRAIASTFTNRAGRRMYGLSLMGVKRAEKLFYLEWIRSHATLPVNMLPFDQLFRIVYQTFSDDHVSTITFDDIRAKTHLAIYDYAKLWGPHASTSVFAIYHKKEAPFEAVNWYLGLRCSLKL